MNLENMMLRDRGQTQKATDLCFHPYNMSTTGKSRETESRGAPAQRRSGEQRDCGRAHALLPGAEDGLRGMVRGAKL